MAPARVASPCSPSVSVTRATPKVASAAMSCGRRRRPAGSSGVPVVASSPRWMMFAPAATPRLIATDLDPKALQPGLTREELAAALKDHVKGSAGLVTRFKHL